MTRSSRIIIIFVVIALMLGIGCLFLIDFSGDAQNLQNAQKNTVTEVENDAPGNKKVEADRWSVIEGRLSIFPDTPIIFIEDPIFPHTFYDERVAKEVRRKNDTLKEIFNHLKKRNEKNIILISSKNMLGEDGEATIDGIHFTDLGMMRYADLVCPVVKKAIR